MEEVVRIIQDGDLYRVYINMEHQSTSKYTVLDFVRKLPYNTRKYHAQLRYWTVAPSELASLLNLVANQGISYEFKGELKTDLVQAVVDDTAFQRMGICKKCQQYAGLFLTTGLCSRCS